MVATVPDKESYRRRSALELYMNDIAYVELVTPREEIRLAYQIKGGDRKAQERLVEAHVRLVITIAKGYQGAGLPLEDLIANGNVGLLKATTKFDPENGARFSTYSAWWIRQGILAGLAEYARTVRLPVNKIKYLQRINRAGAELSQELGRNPEFHEIAERTGSTLEEVRDAISYSQHTVSTDTPIDDTNNTIHDIVGKDDERLVDPNNGLAELVQSAIASVSPREGQILKMYFGIDGDEPMTLEQIGNQFNLTKERVRQIRDKALAYLKKHSKRNGLVDYLYVA